MRPLEAFAGSLENRVGHAVKRGSHTIAVSNSEAAELIAAIEALKPFADKADKWEANHPGAAQTGSGRDSTQVQHRLGDFRAARDALNGSST